MRPQTIALWLSLSLAACSNEKPAGQGGGDKSPPAGEAKPGGQPAKGRDACALLTLDDVRKAYGPSMEKSGGVGNQNVSGPSNDLSTCTYQGGDPLVVVTLMATFTNSAEGNPMASRDAYAKAAVDQVPADMREALKVETVDFQGLPALWQAGQLKVFKAGAMLSILADPVPGKSAKETMEALMATALGRL
ncbi:MAG TPA: hypothetical protein VN923_07980 [Thermoanaerobaculia bacterium]|nr:hypothetical protein [Thermoanaerobaculia bacterium]